MNWNRWIRQFHRWVSIIFAVLVAGIFAMQGAGIQPEQWIYYLPLLPLFLLLFSGLYLFALPYFGRRRVAEG